MAMLVREELARAASEVHSAARRPQALSAVLSDLDRALRAGETRRRQPAPTGFAMLDRTISGGLKPGELMLIGGAQGLGKTTLTLQMARNMAAAGANVLYVCYEHEERFLLTRLLALESTDPSDEEDESGMRLRDVVLQLERTAGQGDASLERVAATAPALGRACARVAAYAERLLLLRGSATYTDLAALGGHAAELRAADDRPCVLFVDYLQKVPVQPEPPSEEERVTRVVEGLKEMALSLEIPIVAIVAAEKEGLRAPRLRLHHLRGSSALLYEADIILILNDKYKIVAKHNITFNLHQAQAFHAWVVCTVEKNRAGRDLVDLELKKRFEYACFNPQGRAVAEVLLDERIQIE
jgi:replicative DNA helicase